MIKTDCCANCHHCVDVYDNSEFCYYYCVLNDCRLDSYESQCYCFEEINPKLLYKRPILPIMYIIKKQIKKDIESMKTPSMDK